MLDIMFLYCLHRPTMPPLNTENIAMRMKIEMEHTFMDTASVFTCNFSIKRLRFKRLLILEIMLLLIFHLHTIDHKPEESCCCVNPQADLVPEVKIFEKWLKIIGNFTMNEEQWGRGDH